VLKANLGPTFPHNVEIEKNFESYRLLIGKSDMKCDMNFDVHYRYIFRQILLYVLKIYSLFLI